MHAEPLGHALRMEAVDHKELSKTTKLRVYNAIVKPTLLYGSETWTLAIE